MRPRQRCPTCGEERELVAKPRQVVLHALPELRSPLEIVDPFACSTCGSEIRRTFRFVSTDKAVDLSGMLRDQPAVERQIGHIMRTDGRSAMSLNYPAVSVSAGNFLFPIHEGRLSDGSLIDRYGDPDLMAEFAAEYFKQSRAIAPKGGLPRTLTKTMPALHLLVNAAELALKAHLIRSGKAWGGHDLTALFRRLEDEHREEAERRFSDASQVASLDALGVDRPTVENVLGVYEHGFTGGSVYMQTRYFAEPTTMIRSPSLKGGSLIKDMPYPIFLPVVVRTMLDVYAHFSGAERLKRLGADIARGVRDSGNDQHGDWGLVPSSVGLVVIRVAQHVAWTEQHKDRDAFQRFKTVRPPGYTTSWKYGGQSLLFYRAGEEQPEDGETVIDGLECKVWHTKRLAMHPRDLYLLVDALRSQVGFPVFQWTNSSGASPIPCAR